MEKIHQSLLNLRDASPIKVAISVLWKAVTEEDGAVRYLLLWIVLEGLFGVDDSREIRFRLSQCIALFMNSERNKAKECFRACKEAYDLRSQTAHGFKFKKLNIENANKISLNVEALIRSCFIKILSDDSLIEKFSGANRENFLSELIFENLS